MARSEQEFRDFVAGFADPLARLAFLLSAGTELDPADLTVAALASVWRRWDDVEETGAPEPLAIEALVAALPRARRAAAYAKRVTDDADIAQRVALAVPALGPLPNDVDAGVLRAAAWNAWKALAPRQRVPLLLEDASVAARRLAGIEIAQSSRAARRASAVADDAWRLLGQAMAADPEARRWLDSTDGAHFAAVVRDGLREQAGAAPALLEPYPRVRQRVSRVRLRAVGAVAASLFVLVAVGAIAVRVSAPKKAHVPPVSASTLTDSVSDRGPVVAWPTRGTAAQNGALITKLKAAFLHAHPETTGQVQVLLVTDTSTYRIAYVTAKSPTGVLESWFYGPVGSTDLVEGVVQYGGGLDAHTEILATGLADAQGHTQLVVLAPPGTRKMSVITADTATTTSTSSPLRDTDGIAVKAVPTGSIRSLSVVARVGQSDVVSQGMRTLALSPAFEGASAPFEPQGVPSFAAERGDPDPQVLAQAANDAGLMARQDGPANYVQMKVLWGGTDQAANRIVIVRMKMELSDVLLVSWEDRTGVPRQETEAIADPSTPDAPLAFSYAGSGDPRVAVLGAPGDSSAALVFQGKQQPAVPLDSTGFTSFRLTDDTWLTSAGLAVNLLGPGGNVLKTIPIAAL
ncbi:MAG TPA: hypothetical protein VN683_00905 [Acidothermaceae bacterium]|nr:hypothetical protein [Acidothermaceae bacterium]